MEGRSGPARKGSPWVIRRAGEIVLAAIMAVMFVSIAESQDLNGFFTSSVTLTSADAGGIEADLLTYRHALDVNWNRTVSPVFRYRLSLRGSYNHSEADVDSETTTTTSRLVEPAVDVTLSKPRYSLNTGARFRWSINDGNRVERTTLSERDFFARFFWTPVAFPSVSAQFDRTTQVDDRDPPTRDSVDTRFQISAQYDHDPFNLSYTFSKRTTEDDVAERTRDRQNHTGSFAYSNTFLDGRLSVLANYAGNYVRTVEEFLVPSVADVERELQRVFWAANDLNPVDSSGITWTTVNLAAQPVGLDPNVSVGFELAQRASVSEIRISLAPAAGFSLPDNLQTFLNFRVFFTDDTNLVTWTEASGVSQSFDAVDSVFTLTFVATTARSFKAFVSRSDFGALVTATGIAAFDSEQVQAGQERVTSSFVNNFGATVSYTPLDWLTASYNGFMTLSTQEPDSLETTSATQTVSISAEMHRLLTARLSLQDRFTDSNQPGGEDTRSDTLSLTLISNPLPTLTGTLTFAHTEDRSDGDLDTRTNTASLTAETRLYRNLNTNLTYSFSRSEDFEMDLDSLGHTITLDANATLTPKLSSVLSYTFASRQTEGPDEDVTTQTNTGTLSFTYTVSRLANLNARFDFSDSPGGTSFSQQYRLDWIPTSKVSSFLTYRRINQETEGESGGLDAVNVNGRWNISRALSLNANLTFLRTFDGDQVQTFSGNFEVRF